MISLHLFLVPPFCLCRRDQPCLMGCSSRLSRGARPQSLTEKSLMDESLNGESPAEAVRCKGPHDGAYVGTGVHSPRSVPGDPPTQGASAVQDEPPISGRLLCTSRTGHSICGVLVRSIPSMDQQVTPSEMLQSANFKINPSNSLQSL